MGEVSFWWRSVGGLPPRRAPLPGSLEVDVAIVGGGYTGLWTAFYLKRERPELEIAVLEREMVGYGASGRNGGWVSGFFSGPARVYERGGVPGSFATLQRETFATVDEIAAVLGEQQIEADFVKSGHLAVALNAAQLQALRVDLAGARAQGLGDSDICELTGEQLAGRLAVADAQGATFSPHVARVHPVKLLLGLAEAAERLGVRIYEDTAVSEIRPHEAIAARGRVGARWVVRATEGYTASLRGCERALVPMNSSMIVTEPLAEEVWREIGWDGSEVLSDSAHVYAYLQQTADGRIAIGGRGVPYRFGSRTDGDGETAEGTVRSLRVKLNEMFPAAAGTPTDHAWSGVLGVGRDWCMSVAADADSGIAWAGGYVGEGVASSNLAGRTLRDLILERQTPLTALAWVGRQPKMWEREPLRWAAIHSVYALYRGADRIERRTHRRSQLGRFVDRASGRA
jgi:glycine/D-amino acid oxidase-like deaminating enzyme